MRLPSNSKDLAGWAKEIIEQCEASRQTRIEEGRKNRAYYLNGGYTGSPAQYNRIFSHIDRLSSFLYSADDVRFTIEFDDEYGRTWQRQGDAAARKLNRDFHRCGVDLEIAKAVDWALCKGKTLIKLLWGHNGLEAWLVQPEFMAVLREDVDGLDRQEAFVHSTYITKSELARQIAAKDPKEAERIAKSIAQTAAKRSESPDELQENFIHQVIIGGIGPVQPPSAGSGFSPGFSEAFGGAVGGPTRGNVGLVPLAPQLDPKVAANLVRIDELWVLDSDREDYTTIRLINPDIILDGNLKHRNAMSPFDEGTADEPGDNPLRGEHPFLEICPNPMDGYFWGQSEIMNLANLQDMLSDSIGDIDRLTKLQAQPPAAFIGFSGMTEQRYKTLMVPRGYISEDSPNAKIEKLAPEIPPEIFQKVEKVIAWMDDEGGFAPIMMGQGEPGVRAGMHAQTLLKTGSPRMRDRALLVERQVTAVGDLAFKYLQAKDATVYMSKNPKGEAGGPGDTFLLKQLPDDYRIAVDSHSGSPVFQDDTLQLAFALAKARAITPKSLIMLTRPPHMDSLMEEAENMAKAEAAFMQQHPELAGKGKGHK